MTIETLETSKIFPIITDEKPPIARPTFNDIISRGANVSWIQSRNHRAITRKHSIYKETNNRTADNHGWH